MPDLYVGHAVEKGSTPDDLFHVDEIVKGTDAALPVAETGCHLTWPAAENAGAAHRARG
jgi:branched-chain amino acid transport system substrate-binding protein